MSSSAKRNTTKQKVGKELSKKDITYIELCQMYIRECKLNDIADVTINGYNYANEYFLRFAGKEIMCSEITQELVDDYKMELLKRLKPTTLNSYMFKISPTIKYGHRVGLLKEEILITHVREQETFKDIYTEEELKKLLVRPKNKSFSQYRNWVIINFLIATGKGVHLVSNKENLDSSTPTGKLMLTMIGAINEFERANLLERQREGIAIAKTEGKYKGRKAVEIDNFEEEYKKYLNREFNKVELAKVFGVTRPTLDKLIREHEGKKGS